MSSNGFFDEKVEVVVNQDNGEISCSIEETNRIRALLGLKPLNEQRINKEQAAVKNFHDKIEADRKAKEADELRNRIEVAKTKRILQEKLVQKNLSTIEDEEDESLISAADWVKRSRLKALEKKDEPKPQGLPPPVSFEEEYTSEQLKGLKVMHDFKDFEEGKEIILTLADTSVLKKDERGRIIGVAEDEDVLENLHMTEEMKRQEVERRKKRARQPIYSGYDDDEFAEGIAPGSKRSILSHYDKEQKSGPKFVIGSDISHLKSESQIENRPSAISLQQSERSHEMSDDFYTAEEAATFKKRNTAKAKKLRRVNKSDENEDNEADLDVILAAEPSSSSKDRGSRGNITTSRVDEINANITRRQENYEKAVKAAELKTKEAFAGKESREKVDILLQESIERLQRLKESRKEAEEKKSVEIVDRGAAAALQLLEKQRALRHMDHGVNEMKLEVNSPALDEIDTEGRRKDGTLIFSSTTEFTARLQAQLNDKARLQAEKAIFSEDRYSTARRPFEGTTSVGFQDSSQMISKTSADNLESMDVDDDDVQEDVDEENNMDDDDRNSDDQLTFLHHQPLASRSTAAALSLLKGSGDLKPKPILAGRAKDSRDILLNEPKSEGVKIEYRDEYGRELTKKEAYRQLCYRFHGYGPGKMKKDKRLKAMEAQKKAGTSVAAGETITMKSLERAQEATGKAHVTIQGNSGTAASNAVSLSALAAQLLAKAKKKQNAALKKKKTN